MKNTHTVFGNYTLPTVFLLATFSLVCLQPAIAQDTSATETDTLALLADYHDALDYEAAQELFRRNVMPQVLTEPVLRDFYEQDRWEVNASHILVTVTTDSADGAAYALLWKLRQKLLDGEATFEELARQHSEDPSTPDGEIGWFSRGAMVEKFEEVVWALEPGQISEPFKTSYGWHIARVNDKRERQDYPPFDQQRARLENKLARLHQAEMQQATLYYLEALKERRGYTVHEDNIQAVYTASGLASSTRSLPEQLTAPMREMPLVSADGGALVLTIVDLYERAPDEEALEQAFDSPHTLQEVAEIVFRDYIFVPDEARREGIYEDPGVIRRARKTAGLPVNEP